MLGSEAAGRRAGVVADERILDEDGRAGVFGFACRAGLRSWWLFLRDLVPGFAEEALEVFVRESGLVGEGSRDGSGEGAADDVAVEATEGCDGSFEGHESVLGVIVTMLDVDSRDRAGWRFGSLGEGEGEDERVASGEPLEMLSGLSMFCMLGCVES